MVRGTTADGGARNEPSMLQRAVVVFRHPQARRKPSPDGKPGIDISGYTMKSMYEEMSKGAYTVTGEATPWVTVDHSEAWYGATVCHQNDEGVYQYGAIQDMQGHPDNPLGPGQLPIDAVAALAEAQPDFPWSDYDIEDQGDVDGDNNLNEPDGVIDHVVLVHAGADKSGGGGQEGTYAIWAHSSAVAGGADIPGTGLKLSNYIVRRYGRSADVAALVTFLCSDAASWITGQTYPLNGGYVTA